MVIAPTHWWRTPSPHKIFLPKACAFPRGCLMRSQIRPPPSTRHRPCWRSAWHALLHHVRCKVGFPNWCSTGHSFCRVLMGVPTKSDSNSDQFGKYISLLYDLEGRLICYYGSPQKESNGFIWPGSDFVWGICQLYTQHHFRKFHSVCVCLHVCKAPFREFAICHYMVPKLWTGLLQIDVSFFFF